jgi:hypothetical protein
MGVSGRVGMLVVSVQEMVSTAAATTEPAAKMRIRSSMLWSAGSTAETDRAGILPPEEEVPPSYDVWSGLVCGHGACDVLARKA